MIPSSTPTHSDSANRRLIDWLDLAEHSLRLGCWAYRFDEDRATWTPGFAELLGIEGGGGLDTLDGFLDHFDVEGQDTLARQLAHALRDQLHELPFSTEAQASRQTLSGTLRLHYEEGRPVELIGVMQSSPVENTSQAQTQPESLAHEFRRHLNAIVMGIELMRNGDLAKSRSAAMLDIMARQARAMTALIYRLASAAGATDEEEVSNRHAERAETRANTKSFDATDRPA